MSHTRALTRLVPFLLCLPLFGCAAGYGNYGPGGLTDRIGERSSSTYHTGPDNRLYRTTRRWKESSSWGGALAFGVSFGRDENSLTGMRDTTVDRSKYLHTDVVVNVADDRASIGGSLGYLSTKFTGSPTNLNYSGITLGPLVFVRLMPFVSVSGAMLKVFGSVKDPDGYYFVPRYDFLDGKQALGGWRREAYLNVIPIRTEQIDLGVRIGYQQTETDEKLIYTENRKFKSSGPMFELLAFIF